MNEFYKTSSAPTEDDIFDFLLAVKGVDTGIVKQAKKSDDIKKRLIGGAIGAGGTLMGISQYNKSKKNKEGYSQRERDIAVRKAKRKTEESMGVKRSKISKSIDAKRDKLDQFLSDNPGKATALGVVAGGTASGLGMHHLLKNIKKSIPKK